MSEIEDEKFTAETFDAWVMEVLSSQARKWLYTIDEDQLNGLYWAYVTGARQDTLSLTAYVFESYAQREYISRLYRNGDC